MAWFVLVLPRAVRRRAARCLPRGLARIGLALEEGVEPKLRIAPAPAVLEEQQATALAALEKLDAWPQEPS
jgi:hypothetical protein